MALSTSTLVTLAKVKCYLGLTDEDNDRILEALIERASGFLERYCNRKFTSRAYTREAYEGNGTRILLLEQYPVTSVGRISEGRANAFYVTNTTATNHAAIEITSSALKYTADGTTTSLTLSSYATVNLLIAAINALAGWSATLVSTSLGTRKATDLLIRPAMYCVSPDLCYCEVPNDELSDYFIVSPGEDRNYGALECPAGWTRGQEYFVDYTAGYTTVPYALEEACLLLTAYRYNQKSQDLSIKSESLGDYSYTRQDITASLPVDLKGEIDLYKKRTL
jgi:hypothetical protein